MGRRKKKPASSTSLMVQALVIAQGGKCAYCPREFTDDDIDVDGPATWPTFDHVVPKSRGGPNTIKNGLAACIPCNGKKGNRKPTKAELATLARITPIALPIYVRMRATRMAAAIRQEETEAALRRATKMPSYARPADRAYVERESRVLTAGPTPEQVARLIRCWHVLQGAVGFARLALDYPSLIAAGRRA